MDIIVILKLIQIMENMQIIMLSFAKKTQVVTSNCFHEMNSVICFANSQNF